MRWFVLIGAALFAEALIAGSAAGIAEGNPRFELVGTNGPTVDVELVIAVDISQSMDMQELAVQREGYAQAIVSKEFLQALRTGPKGKISLTYFEWSGSKDQEVIIPWRVIDGPESADAVAAETMEILVRRGSRTSISGAIRFAVPLFEESPFKGLRRIIDISGDGPNNNGSSVTSARDAALTEGITINGLPIMVKEQPSSRMDGERLELSQNSKKPSVPSSSLKLRAACPSSKSCRSQRGSPVCLARVLKKCGITLGDADCGSLARRRFVLRRSSR